MTKLSDLMQRMARGGYRLHQQWGLMTPEQPETAQHTPEPIKATDGQAGGPDKPFDGTQDNPMPLDSAFPENQHSTYAEDEPVGGE